MTELEAIRPVAVLVCVLHADEAGPIVERWRSARASPLVYAWHGRRGQNSKGERHDWSWVKFWLKGGAGSQAGQGRAFGPRYRAWPDPNLDLTNTFTFAAVPAWIGYRRRVQTR